MLAGYVRKLEVRVWPLSQPLVNQAPLVDAILKALSQTDQLRSLQWTRNGSFSDEVLTAITKLPRLEELEINAHSWYPGAWDPGLMFDLPKLKSLSLILPDRRVADLLPDLLAAQATRDNDGLGAQGLRSLAILSRDSPTFTPEHVARLCPHVGSLTSLTITGCIRLNDSSLVALLSKTPLLEHLALEGVGNTRFLFHSLATQRHVPRLRSFKTTHPGVGHRDSNEFYPSLATFIESGSMLESVTHYCTGVMTGVWPRVPRAFVDRVTAARGPAMKRFEVNGITLAIDDLQALCEGMPGLEYLVCHFEEKDVVSSSSPPSPLRADESEQASAGEHTGEARTAQDGPYPVDLYVRGRRGALHRPKLRADTPTYRRQEPVRTFPPFGPLP